MAVQQFCLRWNNHQPNFVSVFTSLLNNESLVDVTLAAEGRHLQAHRVVLSACSTYFQTLFTVNPCQHPIVILKDVKYNDLKTMVDFMYYGEVNVSQEQLPAILKTAEMLKIKGLAEMPEYSSGGSLHMSKSLSVSSDKGELPTTAADNWSSTEMTRRSASPMSPAMRRKRLRKSSTGSGSGSTVYCISAERTSEELPSEITLIPSPAMVKPEPLPSMLDGNGRGSDSSHPGSLRNSTQEPSTDSEPREGSQDSVEDDHITMMGHSQDSNVGSMDTSLSDTGLGPSTSMGSQHQQNLASQASSSSLSSKAIKRGRPLIRQPRVKKELDPSQPSPDSEPSSPQLLTVPPMRVERQHSEPTPNLLSVPQPAFLVKQLSHPLPSQSPCGPVYRQLSQPGPSPPTLNVQLVTTSEQPLSRVGSPSMMEQVPVLRIVPDQDHSKTSQLRVRTDELRRASSSPQASSPREGFEPQRSVHCPVLRPGPALGCNFCWNTIDGHGRILRRKTKYHCPECQTNLCIVPCFQEYHERQTTSTGVRDSSGSLSPNIFKVLPKTSSI